MTKQKLTNMLAGSALFAAFLVISSFFMLNSAIASQGFMCDATPGHCIHLAPLN